MGGGKIRRDPEKVRLLTPDSPLPEAHKPDEAPTGFCQGRGPADSPKGLDDAKRGFPVRVPDSSLQRIYRKREEKSIPLGYGTILAERLNST